MYNLLIYVKMNRFVLNVVLALSIIMIYTSCNKQDIKPSIIEGLTIDNYPKVDGSTSTAPLNTIIASKLLGAKYKWVKGYNNTQSVELNLKKENSEKIKERVKSSQTHQSFVNLINKEADLILSARKLSEDEKAIADAAGVSLIETPIALDAFVFIIHPKNPIKTLTHKQIQDIYTGKITNWEEVGGSYATIKPYVRNANSGSQELMEALVMKDLGIKEFPVSLSELLAQSMTGAFEVVNNSPFSICYTVYYYKEHIITETPLKSISVNGIFPDKESISNKSYPYVAEVYAVIRDDLDKSSMAHKVYEWLQTKEGKQVISESGYVPY